MPIRLGIMCGYAIVRRAEQLRPCFGMTGLTCPMYRGLELIHASSPCQLAMSKQTRANGPENTIHT